MNIINWFEIPCQNLERAAKFYEAVLDIALQREDFMGVPHAIFKTSTTEGVGGALVQDSNNTPAARGSRVYLSADGKLDACIARIEQHGGQIVQPRTSIGPLGALAMLRDTEGNYVGLHST